MSFLTLEDGVAGKSGLSLTRRVTWDETDAFASDYASQVFAEDAVEGVDQINMLGIVPTAVTRIFE